ncbi:hypothetical protein Pint_25204 [Pistacia integerrima]|uniref:Uncharacterized protein n=1 Tax=Pistacia integerrima TaxID=434235 RepID=A0ACC0YEJ7_9ROSI|nr:hypothetical protein Pint_25204 [Pistacia integerrima]
MYFVIAMKENHLAEILDDCVMNGANLEQLNQVSNLARQSVTVKGEERPTMKEVAMELEGLMILKYPWLKDEPNLEETRQLLGESSDTASHGGEMTTGYDSMKNQEAVTIRVRR